MVVTFVVILDDGAGHFECLQANHREFSADPRQESLRLQSARLRASDPGSTAGARYLHEGD